MIEQYLYSALILIGVALLIAVMVDALRQKENADARRELLEALGWADKDILTAEYSEIINDLEETNERIQSR